MVITNGGTWNSLYGYDKFVAFPEACEISLAWSLRIFDVK